MSETSEPVDIQDALPCDTPITNSTTNTTTNAEESTTPMILPQADRLLQRLHHIKLIFKRALKKLQGKCLLKKLKSLKKE